MTLDPVVVEILQNFVFPVMTWTGVIYAFNVQGRNRRAHPMTYGIVRELVAVGVFKADNLLNIGVLEDESGSEINPLDMLKLIKGG